MHIIFFLISCGLIGYNPVLTAIGLSCASTYLGYEHSKSGGISNQFRDFFVESKVERLWKESNIDEPMLDVCSVNGTPVIIGAATCESGLETAKAIVISQYGSVECIADTKISGGWNNTLAFQVKRKLTLDFAIAARNFEVRAIKSRVWLVGVAQTQIEKDHIIQKVQDMDGVASVVAYIKVVPDVPENGSVELVD